jgi:hypothetical protein
MISRGMPPGYGGSGAAAEAVSLQWHFSAENAALPVPEEDTSALEPP